MFAQGTERTVELEAGAINAGLLMLVTDFDRCSNLDQPSSG